jgi:uncharacterized protein DUF3306
VSDDNFISRWSRRKIQARAEAPAAAVARPAAHGEAAAQGAVPAVPPAATGPAAPAPLPPLESLTPESDFSPFMRADVDPLLRREALKTLFHDPRHNIQDGLDTYIADYSIADPLPEGWLEKMNQVKHLGDYRPPPEDAEGAIDAEAAALPPVEDAAPVPPAVPEALGDDAEAPPQAPPDTAAAAVPTPPVNES